MVKVSWIARRVDISKDAIYRRVKGKASPLTPKQLQEIEDAARDGVEEFVRHLIRKDTINEINECDNLGF